MNQATFAVLIALAALPAVSAPVTVNLSGFAYGAAAVDTSAQTGWIGAGEFSGQITSNGQTASFLTYCTDIFQGFRFGTAYTHELVATGSAHGLSVRQEDLLGKLYTLAGRDVDSTNESAAFQLAVWEIVTETSRSLNLLSGSFYLEQGASSVQRTLANDWLALASSDGAAKQFGAQRLYSSTAQDFVVFTPRPPDPDTANRVPEPGSGGLVGLALLGLAWAGRRKA